MASTEALLNLVESFPEAFADPEASSGGTGAMAQGSRRSSHPSRIQALLDLAAEFPEAFADPEAIAETTTQVEVVEPEIQPMAEVSAMPTVQAALPNGYEYALSRSLSTFTWGTIEVHLKYSTSGLTSLWLVVGKSGTEIQSLCEAICRLTNLLLAHQVPIEEIVRQLRGIRGADSEGLGPHRILGLADAIGKVLQEAPARLSGGGVAPAADMQAEAVAPVQEAVKAEIVTHSDYSQNGSTAVKTGSELLSNSLLNLSDSNHRMSLCPECGSELQAMNGCSGGACQVCGFSSCS